MDKKYKKLFDVNFKNINYLDDLLYSFLNTKFIFKKKTYILNFNQKLINTINDFEFLSNKLTDYYFETYSLKKILKTEIDLINEIFQNLLNENLVQLNKNYFKDEIIIKTKKKILEIRKRFIVLYNMFFGFENYIYDVDLEDYKKLKKSDLEFADIVLSVKSDDLINKNLYTRVIYLITHSHIQHSSIFYENKNKKYYFIDVSSKKLEDFKTNKKTLFTILNYLFIINNLKYGKIERKYSKNNIGLVLRYKNKLTNSEKNTIKKYLDGCIGKSYGLSRVILLSFLYKLFDKIDNYKKLVNLHSKKSIFCSENVIRAYASAGIYLSNKYDESTVTPIDLLNNAELEIIGYLEK